MSEQKRDCKSCRHYGTNIGCLRLVGCSTTDNEHWEQRWDAAKTRQEPAGAPNAGAVIPAQQDEGANAQKRECSTCHYESADGWECLRKDGPCAHDSKLIWWKPRLDAAETRQEPAGAPNAGAAIPAQPEANPGANSRQVGGLHYKPAGIEPWDYIAANGIGFFEGNVIKYVTRWKSKDGVQDLKKARHYIDKLIELQGEQ